MHIAIFTSMMPGIVQDFIYQQVDDRTKATDLVDRVKSWVRNKAAMDSGPTPMDIGNVGGHEEGEEHWHDEDIQGVRANVQCHRCGGWVISSENAPPMVARDVEIIMGRKRARARGREK